MKPSTRAIRTVVQAAIFLGLASVCQGGPELVLEPYGTAGPTGGTVAVVFKNQPAADVFGLQFKLCWESAKVAITAIRPGPAAQATGKTVRPPQPVPGADSALVIVAGLSDLARSKESVPEGTVCYVDYSNAGLLGGGRIYAAEQKYLLPGQRELRNAAAAVVAASDAAGTGFSRVSSNSGCRGTPARPERSPLPLDAVCLLLPALPLLLSSRLRARSTPEEFP